MLPVWTVLLLLPLLGGAERFNCRGRILGAYYADAKSGCKAFHVCVRVAGGGIRDFRFFCPPGTLFHQEAQTCTDWGDDDPLACPADLYDGFDTKKLSSPGNRDDETEFGLQRAETGDRRSQNSQNNGRDDLRAAHSSDFFSGQRDRGRDDAPAPSTPPRAPPARQSFRRATTPRAPPTTQYTQPPSPQPSSPAQYEPVSKQQRKLVRKRPIYVQSTVEPSSPNYQNTPPQQQYTQQPYSQQPFSQPPQQHYHRLPTKPTTIAPADVPPQYKDEYVEVSRVAPKQTPNRYYPNNPTQVPFAQPSSPAQFNKKEGLSELYNYDAQSTPGFNVQNENRQPFKVRNNFNVADTPRDDFARTNYNSNNGRSTPTTTEYTTTTRNFPTSTPAYNNRNFNNVAYEPEKNNFAQYREPKQNYYSSPTTIPTTTFYTTTRPESHANLNTVAYNTNIALNTIQPANYPDNDEDDGQYRPPAGEDDGQYRPELYERDRERDRELLSGAHSLNIAASGNRLPEDQKAHSKVNHVKLQGQTSAPRPFRPAPTPTSPPTTRAPEPTYTTTYRPTTTVNTQRTFDYFQTYTTTSRPYSEQSTTNNNFNNAPVRSQSTSAPRVPEVRPTVAAPRPPELKLTSPPRPAAEPKQRAPAPPTVAPARPTTRAPHFSQPANKKEDASYDYAYYDSDPGFSEYDHIEEFGKTKTRT